LVVPDTAELRFAVVASVPEVGSVRAVVPVVVRVVAKLPEVVKFPPRMRVEEDQLVVEPSVVRYRLAFPVCVGRIWTEQLVDPGVQDGSRVAPG
jgi:hypothetical protein